MRCFHTPALAVGSCLLESFFLALELLRADDAQHGTQLLVGDDVRGHEAMLFGFA